MIEVDDKVHLETIIRLEEGILVSVLDPHRTLDAHEALGPILLLDPRRLNEKDEGCGAAVHDGHFGGADIDIGVIDAQSGEGGQEMLNRGDANPILDQGCG